MYAEAANGRNWGEIVLGFWEAWSEFAVTCQRLGERHQEQVGLSQLLHNESKGAAQRILRDSMWAYVNAPSVQRCRAASLSSPGRVQPTKNLEIVLKILFVSRKLSKKSFYEIIADSQSTFVSLNFYFFMKEEESYDIIDFIKDSFSSSTEQSTSTINLSK